jgi:heme exporter protein CcmB
MTEFLIIFHHQLKILFGNPRNFLNNILFYLCFIVIFFIVLKPLLTINSSGNSSGIANNFGFGYLLIPASFFAMLTCLLSTANNFLNEDFLDGTLEQMAINCKNLEIFIFAKMLANWLNGSFISGIFATLIGVIIGYEINFLWHFLIVFLLTSFVISNIYCLSASLAILGGSTALIAFIALPLILPAILFGSLAIYDDFYLNLKILLALNIFLNPLIIYASSAITKIALD